MAKLQLQTINETIHVLGSLKNPQSDKISMVVKGLVIRLVMGPPARDGAESDHCAVSHSARRASPVHLPGK